MTKAKLIECEQQLGKAQRSAFKCVALILVAMVLIVMVDLLAKVPVDQAGIAEAGTPALLLFGGIAVACGLIRAMIKTYLGGPDISAR